MEFNSKFIEDVQATSNLAWSNSASNAAGPDGGQPQLAGKVLTIAAGSDAIGVRVYQDTTSDTPVKKRTVCYIATDENGNQYKLSPSFLFSPAFVKADYVGAPSYADLKPRTALGSGIQGERINQLFGETEISAYVFNAPVRIEYFNLPKGSVKTVKQWTGQRGSKRATLNAANDRPYLVAALGEFKTKPTEETILSILAKLSFGKALPCFF